MLHNPLGVSDEFKGSSNWGEYGDAMQELDHNVGRIFDTLKQHDLDENTVVIYASNNGRRPGRNADQPIRGNKLTTFEGGIRVPTIARGPGAGIRQGHESSTVVNAMDWFPSLASFANIKVNQERIIDGRDIMPLLKGESNIVPSASSGMALNSDTPLRRRWSPAGEWADLMTRDEYLEALFYHGSQGALAEVRSGPWKLSLNPGLTLYNLVDYPGEKKLVRDRDTLRKLRGMVIMFQEGMRLDARPAGDVFFEK